MINPSSIPPSQQGINEEDDKETDMDLVSRLLDQDTLALLEQNTFEYDENPYSSSSSLFMKNSSTNTNPNSFSKLKGNLISSLDSHPNQQQEEDGDEELWKTSRNRRDLHPKQQQQQQDKQPNLFRDWPFAILFLAQFVSIIILAGIYGIPAWIQIFPSHHHSQEGGGGGDSSVFMTYSRNVLYLTILTSSCSILLSILLLLLMIQQRHQCTILISLSLAISVVSSFLLAIFFLVLFQNILGAILSILCAIVSLGYAMSIRSRIPYAATSLSAALEAIQYSNLTRHFISLALQMTFYFLLWMSLWMLSCMGLMYHHHNTKYRSGQEEKDYTLPAYQIFLLLLSLYWTQQVFIHIVTVTVAGVVGMWWFSPHTITSSSSSVPRSTRGIFSRYCCPSTTILDAWYRASTYSLGSICFGSLITSTIQVLRVLVENARRKKEQDDGRSKNTPQHAILLCVLECILSIMDDIVQYFNRWAYIYVGLYGYTYIQSGKKVYSLFTSRGWTFLINDNLIGHTLSLIGLVIALLSGIFGALVDSFTLNGLFPNVGEGSTYLSFL